MTDERILPVILSGGGGTRLWPQSTEAKPKQFQALIGEQSLYRQTLERVADENRYAAPIVVANVRHADRCEEGLAGLRPARLVLEPVARNTAAAIGLAARIALSGADDDPLLLVMPSDHVISDAEAFHAAVQRGVAAAREGRLVTFGIEPDRPETGFGYIEQGDPIPGCPGVMSVSEFVEKPPLAEARKMASSGRHSWNGGIFLFRASTLLNELKTHVPDVARCVDRAIADARQDGVRIVPSAAALEACPSESIDYAVMERSERVAVVPMDPGWSDVGSWDALADLIGEERSGPVTAIDCENCFIRSDGIEIAALGIEDLIIVAAGSRILVVPRGRSQEVKALLAAMDMAKA